MQNSKPLAVNTNYSCSPSNPTRLETLAAAAALAAQRSANNNPRRWIMQQRFKKHLQRLAPHQRVHRH
jgi:hypothetical protein